MFENMNATLQNLSVITTWLALIINLSVSVKINVNNFTADLKNTVCMFVWEV